MLIDLLHLGRNLRRSPASAAAAVAVLALTLGAGASIFAVVDAVLLTPPPFSDPESLFILGEVPLEDSTAAPRTVLYATFEAWRDRAASLAALEASDGTNLTLTGLGAAERVSGYNVTPGFLPLLGAAPRLGRTFHPGDVGQRFVIVSHAFWRTKLAADPAVIGRQIVLGNEAHTIVGVLSERFSLAFNRSDFLRPFPVTPAEAVRGGYRVSAMARLAGHRAAPHLENALDEVSRTSSPPARVVATPLTAAIAGNATRPLTLLAAATALTVLIAFINLAALLVVRSIDRQRELAVRRALGARRVDIVRQLLLEAETLVVLGTAGGVLVAVWLTPMVGRLALEQFGAVANRDVTVTWRVIGALATVAAVSSAICGSVPGVLASRRSVVDVLRRGATARPRELMVRRVFVIAEVAVAFVLLVSLTLVGRSLLNALRVHPGFDVNGLLVMGVSLPAAKYLGGERVASFYTTLQGALEERLGPGTIGIVNEIPLTHDRGRAVVRIRPTDPGREAVVREVSTAYFDVMRIPIVAGRSFDARDNSSAKPRVVLSESLAAGLFPVESPIGRHIRLQGRRQEAEVIGAVGDVKHRGLDEGVSPTLYLSAWQSPSHSSVVVARSERPEADVIAAVREEVARLDSNLPVYGMRPMRDVVARSPGMPVRRVLTATFTGFALLAIVLGAIGLFGVVAHDVASRRKELALRIALGADPKRIVRAVLGQGAVMVGLGLAAGGVMSIWAARALSGLVSVTGFDAVSVGVATGVLMVAGLAAVLPAARGAARTDPQIALRSE